VTVAQNDRAIVDFPAVDFPASRLKTPRCNQFRHNQETGSGSIEPALTKITRASSAAPIGGAPRSGGAASVPGLKVSVV
jgi:hypothetical protein